MISWVGDIPHLGETNLLIDRNLSRFTIFWGVSAVGGRKPSVPNPTANLVSTRRKTIALLYKQSLFSYVFLCCFKKGSFFFL